ncbi:MAG: glycoside hydrolase family 38 C-terminal domain-containing protein, partial [Bacillota bacterium]|nr:glycoside hydrolase family 38 C-terminal domain-containing protein [Bacillota bacterium]
MNQTHDYGDHQIHLIGSAHIDPVWLWTWTDGYSEVKATFQSALDRIDEYPDFVFTCAGACYYQWVEQSDPVMFEKIRKAVQKGQWVPVNGWFIQPDCNIPCGESFARHGLYSQRYYLEKFGILCDTGYNVDSFGHNGMLPQILRLSGMNHYVFSRPSDKEKPGVANVFNWQSADGSTVLAYKIPFSYNHEQPETLADKIVQVARIGQTLDTDMMVFYGVGNHGGGPTIALLEQIEKLRGQPGFIKFRYSSPPAAMKAMRHNEQSLQVVKDDLQYHAIGCYSAMLQVKQQNRQAEIRLLSAERFDTLACSLLGGTGQTAALKKAWEKVMFNQFHDILAGCSLKAAYADAANLYGYALCTAGEVMNQAIQKISWSIDTMGRDGLPRTKEEDWKLWGQAAKGTPLVVFNPLPFAVTVPVEACGDLHAVVRTPQSEAIGPDLLAVTDADGNQLAIQQVRSTISNGKNGRWNTLFLARLPALGYATFWLHKHVLPDNITSGSQPADQLSQSKDQSGQTCRVDLSDNGACMENDFVSVLFSAQEGFTGIYDKRLGKQLLKSPALALVIDETHSDTWGHGLKEYRDVIGQFGNGRLQVIENGPVRCAVRLTTSWQQSQIDQDFYLLADRPEIEVRVKVFWREKHRMLKMEFPLQIPDAKTSAEIPYGFIERVMDGAEKPIQQWVDVSNDQFGVSILNDSSYAVDVKDSAVRMTVLRGAAFADHYGVRDDRCDYMEQGESFVKYVISPHAGSWKTAKTVQKAQALNTPIPIVYETYHQGPLPLSDSGLGINSDTVVMTVFKLAEDGDGYILRCYESAGMATHTEIS